ncbi:hypothetical protein LguiB_008565 [Lonicera macranthoides]
MMNNNNKSNSYASPESSSPPTPSSPLPLSVGPGNQRYCFSSSPSPSPPFSPSPSTTFTSCTSAENLPHPHKNIIQHYTFCLSTTDSSNKSNTLPLTAAAAAELPSSTFSLDHHDCLSRTTSSCLQDLSKKKAERTLDEKLENYRKLPEPKTVKTPRNL